MEINPNGRIPALTDSWADGKPIRIFESGAILEYLVDRYDKEHKFSYPKDSREFWEVKSWVRYARSENAANLLAHVADGRLGSNARPAGAF